MQEEVETISISINKSAVVFIFLMSISGIVSGQYYNDGTNLGSSSNSFEIPSYESNEEIATELVGPFLLVALVLRIGFSRALYFTLDTSHIPGQRKKEKGKIDRQATILSLIIAGMMIPTPAFQHLNTFTSWIFGGGLYLLMGIALIYFIYKLVTDLW